MALSFLRISNENQQTIWKILAAILHLGNVEITEKKDAAQIPHPESTRDLCFWTLKFFFFFLALQKVAELLQVNATSLQTALLKKVTQVKGEKISANLKKDQVPIVFSVYEKWNFSGFDQRLKITEMLWAKRFIPNYSNGLSNTSILWSKRWAIRHSSEFWIFLVLKTFNATVLNNFACNFGYFSFRFLTFCFQKLFKWKTSKLFQWAYLQVGTSWICNRKHSMD